ncbi:hypothetical protein NQ317_003840 [Molorchus minor]|uniref:alpha-mannosidase n=1 Tax=Molorchus minor TaxID=1323400 RepID=A0ABQ9J037_9CUCU|nr:hypothetical protein NQ317_003840 [Molorchus minor]
MPLMMTLKVLTITSNGRGFRGNAKYNVFYSTPSCYYQAVTQSNPNLITISDDFFPYAENDHAYWTGYYTSRPTTKRFERIGNNILQASQQLNAFANMKNDNKSIDYNENLTSLREVMGTMQHHDAITGTEKEKVALDYVRLLTKAIRETEEPMGQIIGDLLRKENVTERITLPISTCLLTNISICDDSLKDRFMVTVYNPLSRYVTYYVRLPSYNSTYNITGPDGEETYDIVPHMYYSINSTSQASEAELVFAARNIPPLGIKYYYVQKLNDKVNGVEVADNKTFGSSGVSFTLDDNNLLQSVTMNNRTVSINQKFLAYISNNGTGDSIASGAYLFRPLNGTDAYHIDYIFGKDNVNETTQNRVKASYTRGNLVDEVIQVFNDWLTQTIRVYKEPENNYIEFDWIVGPLDNDTVDTEYNHGKEVITRFLVSDVDHEDFYTDSNGREMITRKRKHYPYGNSSFEPVTSNYYPVTSKISIEDKSKDIRVAVLNDRSQGGSSLWGGEIELMIHRRLLRDDYKGVDESLQEMEFGKYLVVRGQHYLVIGSATTDSDIKSTAAQERELALKKLLQPLVLVGDATEEAWSLENIQSKINFEWSGLKAALPDNVNILNLEPWKDGSYLLRLEHILAKDEDMNYSKEVSVNVSDIFAPHSISSIRETTLAANDWLSPSDTASLDDFKAKNDDDYATPSIPRYLNENGTQISLTPMQIRTFVVELFDNIIILLVIPAMKKNAVFFVLLFVYGVKSVPLNSHGSKGSFAGHLGCVKCHSVNQTKINVHLIPHSHDDVGWLKTVDQYFFGMNTSIQQAGVQYIITSVVEALSENPDRRFIQVETAFFWKWWKSQTEQMQQKFKSLVDNGQLEMVNGAWSMNDEACSNYQSIIDQFTWGLRTINDTIGTCGTPHVGWQIDPFGHSREQASLFAQLGYDGVFFSRLDHDDEAKRQSEGNLNFAWQGSANLDNSVILGGIFPTSSYGAPKGYCWDYNCADDPVNDDPDSVDYNIDVLVENFVNLTKTYRTYYPTNNVIIAMGEDFQYEAAEMYYTNMDKFIKAFQNHEELNVIYSTPSCYIQAVHEAQPDLQLKTDDFFPYSNDAHSFWTGYFTSRPNSKRFERTGHNILQVTKQLIAIGGLNGTDKYSENLRFLREAMGVMQHHDAITGTEKQHVVRDYVKLLTRAIQYAEKPIGDILQTLLGIDPAEDLDVNLQLSSCLLSNISICEVSQESNTFTVVVYNPLSWPVTQFIRLPVDGKMFNIQGPDGEEKYDIVDPISDFSYVSGHYQPADNELVFSAKDVPPMGVKLYFVNQTTTSNTSFPPVGNDDYSFGDDQTGFEINNDTNLLESVTINGITLNITQNFYYYYSESGKVDNTNISSGAYLFRPTNSTPESLDGIVTTVGSTRGELVEEFHQKWNDGQVDVSQIIRIYKNEKYIEFDWLVGGINITDDMGKEIISRFTITSDFNNNNTFYTDSNGREIIKRVVNHRPDYTYNSSVEPVASNYYPVTSRIVIRDDEKDVEVAVLTDRSQGGSNLHNGEIELMVHRRMLHDDLKGVGESLNETEFGSGVYVRGSHYLIVGSATKPNSDGKTTAAQERILAQKKLVQPWVGVGRISSDTLTYDEIQKKYSLLKNALPENVNILTFEPWTNGTFLLRLEHILEQKEDPTLSETATISLNDIFNDYTIDEITETTLGANQILDKFNEIPRYIWNTTGQKMDVKPTVTDNSKSSISLTPMQIRTFIVKIVPDKENFGVVLKPVSLMFFFTAVLLYITIYDGENGYVLIRR